MSCGPAVRIDTPSTYTSIRGASWSRRLRALSIASTADASSAFWLRLVVRCVSQACQATMAEPITATTTAALVHPLDDPARWACLTAPRAYSCSHGHSDCIVKAYAGLPAAKDRPAGKGMAQPAGMGMAPASQYGHGTPGGPRGNVKAAH